jgi:trk system potassium uptake protein
VLGLAMLGWTGLDPAMTLYDAVGYALSVVALGGFATHGDSAASFAPVTQYLLLVLMIVAGINFLRLYRVLVQRHLHVLRRDEELRLYLAFAAVGSALIILELLAGGFASGEEAFRNGAFQTVAVMTTTGFGTADSTAWGPLATMTLLLLMFVGASAGSTTGSIKVVRHLLLFKIVRRELEQVIHREAVVPIRVGGAVVEERALRSAIVFVLLYLLTFALGALALLIDARAGGTELAVFDAIGASAACVGNVGAAFGFAGPFGSYEGFSDVSTVVLTGLMWLGRVEIIPIAVLLSRNYWR